MAGWTSDELNKIGKTEEFEIAPLRRDGTLRNPVTIWVVRIGDDLYIRAVNGREGAWFRATRCGMKATSRLVVSTKTLPSRTLILVSMTRSMPPTAQSTTTMPPISSTPS
jgi:hypothetical protein